MCAMHQAAECQADNMDAPHVCYAMEVRAIQPSKEVHMTYITCPLSGVELSVPDIYLCMLGRGYVGQGETQYRSRPYPSPGFSRASL